MALQRLKEAAEKAKIELSSTTSTEIGTLHYACKRVQNIWFVLYNVQNSSN